MEESSKQVFWPWQLQNSYDTYEGLGKVTRFFFLSAKINVGKMMYITPMDQISQMI